jgi:hypothetical protein
MLATTGSKGHFNNVASSMQSNGASKNKVFEMSSQNSQSVPKGVMAQYNSNKEVSH